MLGFGFSLTGPSPAASGGGAPYAFANAEAEAVAAAMDAEPDDSRKALIDNLVGALKAGGVWAKLHRLCVHAAHTEQAALIDWPTLTPRSKTGAPTFTADQGFRGNGATANVGPILMSPDTAGDLHVGCYVVEANGHTTGDVVGSSALLLRVADTPAFKLNSDTTRSGSAGSNRHYMCAVRPSFDSHVMYLDGGGGTGFDDSATVDNMLVTWARNPTRTVAVFHAGTAVTQQQAAAAHAAFRTYLQAVGAPVP